MKLPSSPRGDTTARRSPRRRLALSGLCISALACAANADDLSDLANLSLEELTQVEITSVSRTAEKLSDSPAAVQVVTAEEIRRSGATNIPEALRAGSNLNVAQRRSGEWIVSARGFNSDVGNKLLVMMDGRTVYTPLFSGVSWGVQDYLLADLDRIEVVSGPGGTLWGANAVNGVINIISRNARDTQGFYAEGGGGTQLEASGAARYGGKLGENTFYRVYGKYFQRGNSTLTDGGQASDAWHMGQGGFRIDSELGAADNLTVQGDYYENQSGSSAPRGRASGGNVLARWAHRISDTADTALQVYYDRTDVTIPEAPFVIPGLVFAPAGIFKDSLDTVDIDFQNHIAWRDRHRIVWGLGYRHTHDNTQTAPALGFIPENLDQNLYSAFVQDEVAVIQDKVYLTLGTKLEHTYYTGFEVEPSVRLQWKLTDRRMLWAAVSRAVRAPSRIDTDFTEPAPPYPQILVGGPDFKSETVIAYELGGRAQLGERVNASLSAFYNEYDRIRSAGLTPVTLLPIVFENNVRGHTYGFELNVDYQAADWWQLRLGYTRLEEKLHVKAGAFDLNNALNETADPENQFSLHSAMNLPHNLELDAGLRWIDELPTNNSGALVIVPDYADLNLRVGWRPAEHVELSLVGQNLLHDHHQEFGVPSPAQTEAERSFFGKLVWRF